MLVRACVILLVDDPILTRFLSLAFDQALFVASPVAHPF
jgi:hypothetical protein